MDLFDQLKAFVATARTGSFTAAGEELGVSHRLPARYVAELEQRLGVRLFQRTTRRVGLTPIGEALLSRAPKLLDDFDDLISEVSEEAHQMSGDIRVSAPFSFGETYVTGLLGRFTRQYPDISIDLKLSDKPVELAEDGIDLAFIIGRTDPRLLETRLLGRFQFGVFASPSYLDKYGTPHSIADLSMHSCLGDSTRPSTRRWQFKQDDKEGSVPVKVTYRVNSTRSVLDLAVEGVALAYTPEFAALAKVQSGELVQVLQDYAWESQTVSLAQLAGRVIPRKLVALVDFALEDAKAHSGLDPIYTEDDERD